MSQRPYPPRPPRPPRAEPSIDGWILAAVALFGARRVLDRPLLHRRLAMIGLTWKEVAPLLSRIRTVDQWAQIFGDAAEERAVSEDFRRAAAFAFLGHLILSPHHPRKEPLLKAVRRYQSADRARQTDRFTFEQLSLCEGQIAGYREVPLSPTRLPVVLLPPLASTKEEMTLFADPLLAQGHPVFRFDLPGQGESRPPLTPDAEGLLARALDEAGVSGPCLAGGISLGAYFALRLAGNDPGRRIVGVFGVSPPAIITPAQWAKQPEVIYQYLDLYFDTPTRADTLRLGLSMTLDDAVTQVTCPVLLYHATRDTISLPDAAERYRTALSCVSDLTDHLVDDIHGCLNTLASRIVPEVVDWCGRIGKGSHPTI